MQKQDAGSGSGQKKTSERTSGNLTDLPLAVPSGFSFSYFAKNLSGPRVLALNPSGNLVVSLTKAGKVLVLPDRDRSGTSDEAKVILSGLSGPHGLLFTSTGTQTKLFVAEEDRIVRYDYDTKTLTASKPKKIHDLP